MAAEAMEYPQPDMGQTAIPNYLLTDNTVPDNTIRIYGTLVNFVQPASNAPGSDLSSVAVALAVNLEAPGPFICRVRKACKVRMPKYRDGNATSGWRVLRASARDGPANSKGETPIPNAILTDARLSSRDVRVYGIIKAQYDADLGLAVIPQALILWILSNMSKRSLQNRIVALEKAGRIVRVKHGEYNFPPIYRLLEN